MHLSPINNTPPRSPHHNVWAWAGAGAVLATLLTLTLLAPARWLGIALEYASHGHLRLNQSQGTLWQGSAQLELAGGGASLDAVSLPGRVHWQMRPSWGQLDLQLQADCCTVQPLPLTLRPRWGRVELAVGDGLSHWPAGLLAGLGTPWNTVQLQGQLLLSSRRLVLTLTPEQFRFEGDLQLQALGLSSRLSTLHATGSYQLTVQGGEQPRLQLSTLSGRLHLSGQGQWLGARLRFQGTAQAEPGHEAELSNLLNIIGRRDGARSHITLG